MLGLYLSHYLRSACSIRASQSEKSGEESVSDAQGWLILMIGRKGMEIKIFGRN